MDVAALTAFLAPCLGFLLGSGKAVAEAASEKFGEQAWGHVTALWAKLKPAVEEQAAVQVAEQPADDAARSALAQQIESALDSDPELAAEVEGLWKQAEQAGAVVAVERSIAVGGSIIGSQIVTGDHNELRDGR